VNPSSSGPTPLNPRGRGGSEPGDSEDRPTAAGERTESAISNEATAVRTLASAHRLAGEIENEARRKADEITANAELWASQREEEARAHSEAMIAEARAERDRIWDQIRSGVGKATRQVGDLLRIREELRLDLHEAMRDSGEALTRLEDGEETESTRPAAPAWLPGEAPGLPAAPEEPAPEPPIQGSASEVAQTPEPERGEERGSPLSPSGGAAFQPSAAAAQPPPEVAPVEPGETLASMRAGPFESFLAVMRFEREVASLDPIDAVYVRRFANGEVDVELESHGGTDALVAALGAIPGVAEVEHVGGMIRVRMRSDAATRE
jgi:hypothetical protein